MLYIVVDDCSVEIEVKRKGSGMSIHSYMVNIVGYDNFEVVGQREFSQLLSIIEDAIQKAMANLDSFSFITED